MVWSRADSAVRRSATARIRCGAHRSFEDQPDRRRQRCQAAEDSVDRLRCLIRWDEASLAHLCLPLVESGPALRVKKRMRRSCRSWAEVWQSANIDSANEIDRPICQRASVRCWSCSSCWYQQEYASEEYQ